MFVLATVHVGKWNVIKKLIIVFVKKRLSKRLGSDLKRVMEAYLGQQDAVKYFQMVNTVIYSIKSTAYCMQTLVGDGFMVWSSDLPLI